MFTTLDLPHFDKTRVLVFGDVMLDRYWSGPSHRVSPEAPVPVVKIEESESRPGGASNVALNLATLGCEVTLLGMVGKDEEALDLVSQLEKHSVDCQFHYIPEARTISKLRVIARNQQMLRLDFESDLKNYASDYLLKLYKKNLANCDVVVLSDYGKGTLQQPEILVALARKKNIPILVDPKGTDFKRYRGANVITPNLAEFEAIAGSCKGDINVMVEKAKDMIATHQFDSILVTRGKQGMSMIFAEDREPIHLAAHAREVFDVTGAGDTVIALMSVGLVSHLTIEKTVYLANLAAGLVVRKVGTATVTVPELRQHLRTELSIDQGMVTESELLEIVKDAKSKGEKVVMTNGCFDILHPGHIQYLQQAKELGDRLIVAVNSDESVNRLKGDTRPINPLSVRMELLAALRAVDWVVAFDEDTPRRLISTVLPDYLVKGGDYKAEEVVGFKEVTANGGTVQILPFRTGFSTTAFVEKLKGVEECIS